MLQNVFKKLKQFLTQKLLRGNVCDSLTMISILSYGVIFSYFTILKHYNFNSYSDLALFDQALHTTLFNGKLLYYTTEQWLVPSGVFFGVHFSPIVFLLLPVYAVYPSSESLLVTQSFLLAFAALPLYMLSAKLLKSKGAGFAMVVVYLLYTPLQGANWFDFHPQAFIPILLFAAYYFATNRSWKLYFVNVILALMIEEHLVYIVFLLALYLLLKDRFGSLTNLVRSPNASLGKLRRYLSLDTLRNMLGLGGTFNSVSASIWSLITCVMWFLLTRLIKGFYPPNPEFLDIYRAQGAFTKLGYGGDILYLPIFMVFNPQNVFNALVFDFPTKFLYIAILFGPLLFLPFRSKLTLITLVVLGSMLLTNYVPYYTVGAQYPLYIIPLVFIAAIESLSTVQNSKPEESNLHLQSENARQRNSNTRSTKRLLKNMIIVSMIFFASTSPLSPLAYTFSQSGLFWYPAPTQFKTVSYAVPLHKMIALIPPSASILTQNSIFPHVSSRINAYLVPIVMFSEPQQMKEMENYVRQVINETEYVLLDSGVSDYWTLFVRQEISKGQFGLYALTYSFILFKRDYKGAPMFIPDVNYEIFPAYEDSVIQNGEIVYDKSSESGHVALSRKGKDNGTFVYGPYVCLPQGNLSVTFEVKVQDQEQGRVASLDVVSDYGNTVFASRTLYGSELTNERWINVTLSVSTPTLVSNVEFRIFTSGLANVYADRIIVEMLK